MKLVSVLTWLLGVGLVLTIAFELGRDVERAEWLEHAQTDQSAARAAFARDLKKADDATAAAQADARAAHDFATQLQQEVRHVHVPLVAVEPARCAPARARSTPAVRTDARPDVHSAPAVAAAASAAGSQPVAATLVEPSRADRGGGTRLTVAAVRLWNDALAGERVPAGACGPDDTPASACAAPSFVDFGDALSNHVENAATCRADRAAYQRLIDYLQQREGAAR